MRYLSGNWFDKASAVKFYVNQLPFNELVTHTAITPFGFVAVRIDAKGVHRLDILALDLVYNKYFMRTVTEGTAESLRYTKGIPKYLMDLLTPPLLNSTAQFRNIVRLINN